MGTKRIGKRSNTTRYFNKTLLVNETVLIANFEADDKKKTKRFRAETGRKARRVVMIVIVVVVVFSVVGSTDVALSRSARVGGGERGVRRRARAHALRTA